MGKLRRVTKLQAKRLKQLGYNRDVTAYYLENKARLLNKILFETHVSEDWNHNKNGSQYKKETDPLYPFISAPTLDEVIECCPDTIAEVHIETEVGLCGCLPGYILVGQVSDSYT